MHEPLPLELSLRIRPGSASAVEHLCTQAANLPATVAVAVQPENVSLASNLLFGTGVGVVAALALEDENMVAAARLSVATGATEVAVPNLEPARLNQMRAFLGSATPITVDVTRPTGDVDLGQAEHALLLGADYVAFAPNLPAGRPEQATDLAALAGELRLGGVKFGGAPSDDLAALYRELLTVTADNARFCQTIAAPDQ